MTSATLRRLEEAFWQAAGDPARYAAQLAEDAVHVFPGWGIADRTRVLEGVREAQPWQEVVMEHARAVPLGDAAAALIYKARARRSGRDEYVAAITSVYRREGAQWKLVIHQQTPLGEAGSR